MPRPHRKPTLLRPVASAARELGIHRATLYRWIAVKKLRTHEQDGFRFVNLYDVQELAQKKKQISRGRPLALAKLVAAQKRANAASCRPQPVTTVYAMTNKLRQTWNQKFVNGVLKDEDPSSWTLEYREGMKERLKPIVEFYESLTLPPS